MKPWITGRDGLVSVRATGEMAGTLRRGPDGTWRAVKLREPPAGPGHSGFRTKDDAAGWLYAQHLAALREGQAMTPEQMHRNEQHAAVMAVAHALTAAEREKFLAKTSRWRGMDGAGVADVLDMTVDHDQFLDKTEPFYERFAAQMPDTRANIYALHALIILELELTPGRVWSVLQRAGVVEAPRYPDVEAGLRLADGGRDANSLMLKARAEQGLRAAGISEAVITEFRESVRETGTPGFSRNVADIAKWVTLVDRYTEMPRKIYDPTDDISLVLAEFAGVGGVDGPLNSLQALKNLRSHLDMRAAGTIKSSLLPFYERVPE